MEHRRKGELAKGREEACSGAMKAAPFKERRRATLLRDCTTSPTTRAAGLNPLGTEYEA